MVKGIRGLKCPNHDYVRDNHHLTSSLFQNMFVSA